MYKYKNTLEKTVNDTAFKSTNLLYARVFDIIHFSAYFKERRNYTFQEEREIYSRNCKKPSVTGKSSNEAN